MSFWINSLKRRNQSKNKRRRQRDYCPVSLSQPTFFVGEKVEVTVDGSEWFPGVVTSVNPLQVDSEQAPNWTSLQKYIPPTPSKPPKKL